MLDEEHKEGRRWKKTTHSRICAKAGITRQRLSNWITKSSSRVYPVDSRERKNKNPSFSHGKCQDRIAQIPEDLHSESLPKKCQDGEFFRAELKH